MCTSPQEEQSACGLCGCTKTPSWRKNVLPGALICNACCCFLYRRIRSGRGGTPRGASLARAVSALAQKLLAGRGGRSEAPRVNRQPSKAASLGPAAAAQRGCHGSKLPAGKPGGDSGGRAQGKAAAEHVQGPAQELEAHPGCAPTGQQAQQLLTHMLQQLGEAGLRREQTDMEETGEALRRQRACEKAWQKKFKRQARRQAQAGKQCEQPVQKQAPHARGGTPPATCGVPAAGDALSPEGLREAAWRAAVDQQAAAEAMMAAWRHGYSLPGLKLPGVSPSPLGAAPAVWLLQPEEVEGVNCPLPLPVGLLLLRVHQTAAPGSGGQEQPFLRMLVHSRQDGSLLQAWDSAAAMPGPFRKHPRFGLPCWDSGEGWQLLFPEPQIECHQADLFIAALASFTPVAQQGEPSLPLTPPKVEDSPAACSPVVNSTPADAAALHSPAKRQLFAAPTQPTQHSVPRSVVLTWMAAPEPASRLPQCHSFQHSVVPASPPLDQLPSNSHGSSSLSPGIPEPADLVAWQSGVSSVEHPAYSAQARAACYSRRPVVAAAPWGAHAANAGHDLAVLAAFDAMDDASASPWGPLTSRTCGSSALASPAERASGGSPPAPAAGRAASSAAPAAGLPAKAGCGAAAPRPGDHELLPFIDFDWQEGDLSEGFPEDPFCDAHTLCAWSM